MRIRYDDGITRFVKDTGLIPQQAFWDLDLYRYCRSLQPSLIVNNRVAKGRQEMAGTTAAGSARPSGRG